MHVVLDGQALTLEVADSFWTRLRGLSRRDPADCHDGMLFRFPFTWRWPIRMGGIRFPIQAIWLRQGHVVDVQELPVGAWRWFRPRSAADALIEMNFMAANRDLRNLKSQIVTSKRED